VRSFVKAHGLGNDFVIVDARADGALMSADEAIRWCDRHRGVGADGVLTLLPPRLPGAVMRMHIYNADGSVPEMCGNGLRCAVVAADLGPGRFVVDTDAGPRAVERTGPAEARVSVGRPALLAERLEVAIDGRAWVGAWISMGNPHFVLEPCALGETRALAARHGPALERAPAFPARTNVEFFAPRADGGLELTVFERGAGLTEACGTGAGATAVHAWARGLVPDGAPVTVWLPGGPLEVARGDDGEVTIRGEAILTFRGQAAL
jgi:diaminopimelate epimerase